MCWLYFILVSKDGVMNNAATITVTFDGKIIRMVKTLDRFLNFIMCACACVHAHTNTHTHIHTHTCAYTYLYTHAHIIHYNYTVLNGYFYWLL